MNQKDITGKYKGIQLGYFDYKDEKIFEDKFIDEEFLIEWIIQTASEYDQGITHEGLDFIEEYYGNEYILRKVLEKEPKFPFDASDPYKFLENHRDRSFPVIKDDNNAG